MFMAGVASLIMVTLFIPKTAVFSHFSPVFGDIF